MIRIEKFEWDKRNEQHLLKEHGVSPEEAEEIFKTEPYFRRGRGGEKNGKNTKIQ